MCLLQGTPSNVVGVFDISSSIGLEDVGAENEVVVFPNPANNIIRVDLSKSDLEFNSFSLTDLTGKSLLKGAISLGDLSLAIDVQEIPTGLYVLAIHSKGNIVHKKVAITH